MAMGERREKDLIILYKLINQMEKEDKEYPLLTRGGGTREMKDHHRKPRTERCLHDVQMLSCPQRNMETWNRQRR